MDSLGNIGTGIGQVLTGAAPLAGTAAQLYGQQNASEAVVNANQNAINNQNTTLGNIGNIYQPYTSTGAAATTALGNAEGLNGAAPDYSGFMNMPGYQFAVQQGTQAIQRQAAASGSAYTPNTQAAVGQYVTGTAMQDYNTYIQQLQATSGQGASAANSLGNITYNTGANTSQLMANTGQSQAGMYTGMGQTVAGALGGYTPGYGGAGGYGAGGASGVGSVASGIGNIAKGVGTMFGGNGGPANSSNPYYAAYGPGSSADPNYVAPTSNYGAGNYTNANGFEDLSSPPPDWSMDMSGDTGGDF